MTCNLENELIVVDNSTCEVSTVQLGLFGTDLDGDNKEEILTIESIDSQSDPTAPRRILITTTATNYLVELERGGSNKVLSQNQILSKEYSYPSHLFENYVLFRYGFTKDALAVVDVTTSQTVLHL